ncbi:hypothetical protein Csa_020721 [Cucumis sativus]|uniref:Uncharacterized protein n=1 Tax=Cucumis sativus TaxID=3659 RepID=A0A0A0KBB5_CUCSA|nr:hypothetical protein Csa_020721 [Cucumis sativus]
MEISGNLENKIESKKDNLKDLGAISLLCRSRMETRKDLIGELGVISGRFWSGSLKILVIDMLDFRCKDMQRLKF